MATLKSQAIRRDICNLCDFFLHLLDAYDVICREEMTQAKAVAELQEIKALASKTDEFTLAFVGEYSAGKTTIINLLTDSDMSVGTSVTTTEVVKIGWHNITIIDTPGMGSGYAEHDAATCEWLVAADLLVYVLTPDLLTSNSGRRFTELLDKYKREHELMLVMNMIDKEGNSIEVYKDELQQLLNPRLLENYNPVFISAEYENKSRQINMSSEDRDYYAHEGRFAEFVRTLDGFVLSRREKAALSTPLVKLQILSRKLDFRNDYDQECALLDMQISMYDNAYMEYKSAWSNFEEDLQSSVVSCEGGVFSLLDNPGKDFQGCVDECLRNFGQQIQRIVLRFAEALDSASARLQERAESIQGSDLFQLVTAKMKDADEEMRLLFSVDGVDFSDQGENSDIREMGGRILVEGLERLQHTSCNEYFNTAGEIIQAKNVFDLGAKLALKVDRQLILKVGKKIGYKFKPWESVKLSSKISKAVPFLNVASALWDVVSHFMDKKKREEQAEKLRRFKQDFGNMLQSAAKETAKLVQKDVLEPICARTQEAGRMLKERKLCIVQRSLDSNKALAVLEEKRTQCLELYEDIYGRER